MKTKEKRTYQNPEITKVEIDNQISMVMMSDTNPYGDPWSLAEERQENKANNPYKISQG